MSTSADEKAGVSIFSHHQGCNWYCSASSRCYTDFARATITQDIFIPGPTRPGLTQNTHHFTSLQSEFALQSTGSWLASRPENAVFPTQNKFKLKAESGMALKKREFTSQSGNVDT